jgi:hypothetical protein
MPFALVVFGVLLFVIAIQGVATVKAFGSQFYGDLFGTNGKGGFVLWALALVVVGLIGYIPQLKKPSDAFMGLIILGMVLHNGNFFGQAESAIASGPGAEPGTTGVNSAAATAANPFAGILTNAQALDLANTIGDVPNITDATFDGLSDSNLVGPSGIGGGIGSDAVAGGTAGETPVTVETEPQPVLSGLTNAQLGATSTFGFPALGQGEFSPLNPTIPGGVELVPGLGGNVNGVSPPDNFNLFGDF